MRVECRHGFFYIDGERFWIGACPNASIENAERQHVYHLETAAKFKAVAEFLRDHAYSNREEDAS